MAFALKSKSQGKTQGAEKPAHKRKSASEQSPPGFETSAFQSPAAALSAASVIQAKLKTGEPARGSQGGILQRKCACGGATGISGRCEACSKKRPPGLQAKLKINEPGDAYEQEADRIANQMMAAPASPAVSGAPLRIQRFSGQSNGQAGAAPASVDHALASPGRLLEPALRQDMEQRFGHDFSMVRVHSGAAAERSTQDVNARAYTVGHDIVFDAGRFAPGTSEGRRLIAHELTHVVQQGGANRIYAGRGYENRALSPVSTFMPIQIARAPNPGGVDPKIHPDAMAFVENKLRQFFELLSPRERIRLKMNSTIAIGMATVDKEPRLVYTLPNNYTSREIRAAADRLDLHRWQYKTGIKGRGTVGAPNDAEQLMIGFAEDNRADLHGIAVSRRVCADCGVAIPQYKKGQIQVSVIEDPIPIPRGPKLAPLQPPARTVGGEITIPDKPGPQPQKGGQTQQTGKPVPIKWQNLLVGGKVLIGAGGAFIMVAANAWLYTRFAKFTLDKSFDLVGKKAQEDINKQEQDVMALLKKNPFRKLYAQVHGQIIVYEHPNQLDSPMPMPSLPTAEYDELLIRNQAVEWVGKQEKKSKYLQVYFSTPFIYSIPIELPDAVAFMDHLNFMIDYFKLVIIDNLETRARAYAMSALTSLLTTQDQLQKNPFIALRALEQGHDSISKLFPLLRDSTDPSASIDIQIISDSIQYWDSAIEMLRVLVDPV